MRISRNWEKLPKAKRASFMSIREAVQLLSGKNPLLTSDSVEWYTPKNIIVLVKEVLGSIDLDPCSNSTDEPNVPAAKHFTKADDGLSRDWNGSVYLNPPYGKTIDAWIAKLVAEYECGNVTEAIALLPARTDTDWLHRLREFSRCFIHGRLKFANAKFSAPFPSAVVYLVPVQDLFRESGVIE